MTVDRLTGQHPTGQHPTGQHPTRPHPARPHPARQRPSGQRSARPARPPAPAGLPRLIPAGVGPDASLGAHLARLGPLAYPPSAGALIGVAEAAGLTGRGGAAFPVHRKLSAVIQSGRPPVVVGNGAEGEPASSKDGSLLWLAPHLVLDGLQLVASAAGATRTVLYVHRDAALIAYLSQALAHRFAAGTDRAPVELIEAPHRFLAGEESALVNVINGETARPQFKRPPVYERGVGGRPTLVQNVETLAHLALIARFGADWFRAAGTPAEPGSMLCTVHRADGGSHVVEAGLGAPVRSLLRLGGGGGGRVQAVLCGGYHGAWLDPEHAARLSLDNASLRPAGSFAGAGVLAELPASRCGLAETARVARYLALESAGQCGPCFNGLPHIAGALAELAGLRPGGQVLADVRRWAGLAQGRGACHHPDGFVRFVRSAFTVFEAEIGRHARGQCSATDRRPFLPVPATAASEADWS
ncbi:MAG TPA: NADH-ubiquinone oxidoreductase-F iron-sulfur binding region domain-containing protein [Streptosporangiaceae bacterium]|nr:NADH-ubiquinone oxidoreductase-F iron-sulfur binding region domain-containing protein [Streptosporangiaceae bacterium]